MWKQFYDHIPVIETTIFLVLAFITIFRKKLSSNDEYRFHTQSSQSNKRVGSQDFRNISEECKSSLSKVIETTISKNKIDFGNFLKTFNRSPVVAENAFQYIFCLAGHDIYRENKDFISVTASSIAKCEMISVSHDIILKLVCFLDRVDICRLSNTCRSLAVDLHSDFIWQQMWEQDFGKMWRHSDVLHLRKLRRIIWDPYENWGPPVQGWFRFYLEFEYCWMNWILSGFVTPEKCLIGIDGSIFDITMFLDEHPGSPEV